MFIKVTSFYSDGGLIVSLNLEFILGLYVILVRLFEWVLLKKNLGKMKEIICPLCHISRKQ